MKDLKDIVELSNHYLEGQKSKAKRFKNWQEDSYSIVRSTLHVICKEIISKNDYFKTNLYVDEGNPSLGIYLKSGSVPIQSPDKLSENGFQIHFSPLPNGKISVFVYGHSVGDEPSHYLTIETIDDPLSLTEEKVTDLVFRGIEMIYKTSHLFIGE